jgi:hypothetical protein
MQGVFGGGGGGSSPRYAWHYVPVLYAIHNLWLDAVDAVTALHGDCKEIHRGCLHAGLADLFPSCRFAFPPPCRCQFRTPQRRPPQPCAVPGSCPVRTPHMVHHPGLHRCTGLCALLRHVCASTGTPCAAHAYSCTLSRIRRTRIAAGRKPGLLHVVRFHKLKSCCSVLCSFLLTVNGALPGACRMHPAICRNGIDDKLFTTCCCCCCCCCSDHPVPFPTARCWAHWQGLPSK